MVQIALISLSSAKEILSDFDEATQSLESGISAKFCPLTKFDLDGELSVRRSDYDAVILFHSANEGRLSLTDVEDAKYNTLLPSLCDEFGSQSVLVVGFSVPGLNKNTREEKLKRLKERQPSTFLCSSDVILCQSISQIPEPEWGGFFHSNAPSEKKNSRSEGAKNVLLIGIKPMIPLLIKKAIRELNADTRLTFKTLSACETITNAASFHRVAIVCDSADDFIKFSAAIAHAKQKEGPYKEAITKAAASKTVFLLESSRLHEECQKMFKPLSWFLSSGTSRILQYNFSAEENKVTFPDKGDIQQWTEKYWKKGEKTDPEDKGRLYILWSSLRDAPHFAWSNLFAPFFRWSTAHGRVLLYLCLIVIISVCSYSSSLISGQTRHWSILHSLRSYVILPVWSRVIFPAWSYSSRIIRWCLGYPVDGEWSNNIV